MDVLTYGLLNKKVEEAKNVSGEKITEAVNTYLDENPPTTGATAEQAAQIDKNVADIGELKSDLTELNDSVLDLFIYGATETNIKDFRSGYIHTLTNVSPAINYCTSQLIRAKKGQTIKLLDKANYDLLLTNNDSNHSVFVSFFTNDYTFDEDKEVYLEIRRIDKSELTPEVANELVSLSLNLLDENEIEKYYVGSDKEYTSFTDCLVALQDNTNNKEIYIDAGVYDIFEEIGGMDFANTVNTNDWRDWSVIVPKNTHIIGIGNVIFNFFPPDTISDVASGVLSVINVRDTVEIENITINCKNCRYGIHDDGSGYSIYDKSRHIYRNIIVNKERGKGYPNGFGGGIGKDSEFIFENCIFNSYGIGLSFHNRNNSYGGSITFNDCVFKGSTYGMKFGSMSSFDDTKEYKINVFNSIILSKIGYIKEDGGADRTNPFNLTLVKCNNFTIDSSAYDTLQFEPTIYN